MTGFAIGLICMPYMYALYALYAGMAEGRRGWYHALCHALYVRLMCTPYMYALYALYAGMAEGLGLGTNAMAGLVTRGCLEMQVLPH